MKAKGWLLTSVLFLLAQGAFAQLRAIPQQRPLDSKSPSAFSIPVLLADPAPASVLPPPMNNVARAIPRAYQFAELALFCRLEVQLERATKIPVRFRLGSVDYVDYLEGKREVYLPQR